MTSRAKGRQGVSASLRRMVEDVIKGMQVPKIVYGTVAALDGANPQVFVRLQGISSPTIPAKYPQGMVFATSDVVVCAQVGTDLFILQKLNTTVASGPASGSWVTVGGGGGAPAFSAGVANLGAPWQTVQFRRVADIVEIRGLYVSANANPYTHFFLPTGFRPAVQQTFTADAGQGFARVDVYPTGQVSQQSGVTTSYGSYGGGVRFSVL